MNNIVILCNGEFPRKEYPLYLLEKAEAVVCCDGAAVKYLRRFGQMPEAVIGDMDSLPKKWREELAPIAVLVEEQDDNDMTKAMRYVLEPPVSRCRGSELTEEFPGTCSRTFILIPRKYSAAFVRSDRRKLLRVF